jgi:hypothetical protein
LVVTSVAGVGSHFVSGVGHANSNPHLPMTVLPVTNYSYCFPFIPSLMLSPNLNAKARGSPQDY